MKVANKYESCRSGNYLEDKKNVLCKNRKVGVINTWNYNLLFNLDISIYS